MNKIAALLLLSSATLMAGSKAPSPIITLGKDGLVYAQDAQGNRVPDFSTCGYASSEKEIPAVPARIVIAPVEGDETARIQKAIDYVSALPADTNGLRGAVLLLKGRHLVSGGLLITNSGVVLCGQGAGENGTTLVATGLDRRTLLRVLGRNDCQARANDSWQIADAYVPVGATALHLLSASGLQVGDSIRVIRPSTQAWIDRLGANDFGGGEGGGWKPGDYDLVWNRVVKSIQGDTIVLNAPVTTAIETNLGVGRVETYSWPGRIRNVGIENLRLESTFDASNPKDENHCWFAVTMENAADAWVRQVTFEHFAGSAVALYESCQQITVEDCLSLAPVSEDGGYRRNTFFTMGQQTLFLRCYAERGRHDFAVGDSATGPNAFVQCEATLPAADSGAIESWSSGTLFDNVRIDGNAISLGFRPGNMAGIGWAAANSVLWNCSASVIRCQIPPGAQNWSFGSWGGFEGDGIWRSSNDFMTPASLFAAQLNDRRGNAAIHLPLMARPHEESSNPPVDKAQELATASHQPAPQLKDFILDAANRDPIPCEPGDAKRVEEIGASVSPLRLPRSELRITNGWLTMDGRLLVGGGMDLAWWRGSIRPAGVAAFGPALTRFVPGRSGRGFTDDLDELADLMAAHGAVTLDHHYGLWYDFRRDDHERVRRMDGGVLPPFFEQPFARSGQGTAWDGLSQYDLTKFNPWYWSRLRQFADLADERGLVLFNENYFQHNIIEAGAHWVDCPWRSANNINNTGFPEPPPFAGDKRIFQAELFYDVTQPVRRELHRGFIRQCLDNFTNNANVIQFTSAEFTGPLPFTQFWLDTVAEWKRGHKSKPIIALAAPKDVQDAILADPVRSAAVDVIAFRYWWQTDKGLYAPPGGQNLSPRQFQRLLRPGTPGDLNLAAMAAGYRKKYPAKPVIAASEQGYDLSRCGWAYLCAGGSLPNLPRTTDAGLLAAIPKMRPWLADGANKIYALHEPGKQVLLFGSGGEELDMSAESGVFRLNLVNLKTGQVTTGATVQAGAKVKLPDAAVIWLVKE